MSTELYIPDTIHEQGYDDNIDHADLLHNPIRVVKERYRH